MRSENRSHFPIGQKPVHFTYRLHGSIPKNYDELNRAGEPFWEEDYFDRTVRKGKFDRVIMYVLNNPVKAGLVGHWREWPHSWLNPDFQLLYGN